MIRVDPGDDVLLLGPAQSVVHELHEAQSRIDGRRSAGREEDVVEITWRVRRQPAGQRRSLIVDERPWREVGQLHRLVTDHIGDLLAAVADVDAPHAGRTVEVAAALAVEQVHTIGTRQHGPARGGEIGQVLPRVDELGVCPQDGLCVDHLHLAASAGSVLVARAAAAVTAPRSILGS